MTAKKLFIIGALTLSSLAFAGTKSYEFVLSSPVMAGQTQLKPGQYKVKLDGTTATFTDLRTMKTFSVSVKVEHAGQKFDQTTVNTRSKDGVDNLFQINLGGSDTKLELE